MARTRKSDPGRVGALHYAATPRQRHAKPLVYAYLLLGLLAALHWGESGVQAQGVDGSQVPCAACQSLSLTAAEIPSLPERLAGARVFVRVAPLPRRSRDAAEAGGA